MNKEDLLLEQWKMAAELHQNEDRLIWQRFSYFVTLTGILISGLGVALTAKTKDDDTQYLLLVVISMFGSVVSLAFSSVFQRAFYYHIHRIRQTAQIEKDLLIDGKQVLTLYQRGVDRKLVEANKIMWQFARHPTGHVIVTLSLLIAISWVITGGYGLYLLLHKPCSITAFILVLVLAFMILASAILVIKLLRLVLWEGRWLTEELS